MGFLKSIHKQSFFNDAAYILLNTGLVAVVFAVVLTVESPIPAILLVLLSKWRVVAVRPRYWLPNILTNMVDVIVGVSAVLLMYSVIGSHYAVIIQAIIAVLFAAWLIGLKPRSDLRPVVWQAYIALLVGSSTLFVLSYTISPSIMVILMAGLGYITARHVFSQYKEDHLQFLALVWAFYMASMTWVMNHWLIGYVIPVVDIHIPQATIVIGLVALAAYSVYASFKAHGYVRAQDVAAPIAFCVSVCGVLFLFFSEISIGVL